MSAGEHDRLNKVLEVVALVNSSMDLATIREQTVNSAAELVDAEGSSLLFIDDVSGDLYFDVVSGEKSDFLKSIQLKRGEGVAGWVVSNGQPVIVDDVQNDARFAKRVDQKSGFITRNIICVPVRYKDRLIGALQAINKQHGSFTKEDQHLLSTLAGQVAIAVENARLYNDLRTAFHSTVQTLVDSMDMHDPHTTGHAKRVAIYSLAIAKKIGIPPSKLGTLKLAAILHDVGMVSMSEETTKRVVSNPSDMRRVIARHVDNGVQLVSKVKQLADCLPGIKHHHESYNGDGYPDGLKGNQIPLMARIIAVADAFDGMTHKRPYYKPASQIEALRIIQEQAGKQYDPGIVEAFVELYHNGKLGLA